jgi:hypothetical protein
MDVRLHGSPPVAWLIFDYRSGGIMANEDRAPQDICHTKKWKDGADQAKSCGLDNLYWLIVNRLEKQIAE